jgi:hypothetical protein
MAKRSKKIHRFHAAALTAAIVAVVLIATGVSLWHIDAPGSSATCPICHFAHVSALPGLPAESVNVHLSVAWVLPGEAMAGNAAPVLRASAPRAPPA